MFGYRRFWRVLLIGSACLGAFSSVTLAQGVSSVALERRVPADPGQTVALGLAVSSPDSVAGLDLLFEFNPEVLTFSSFEALRRFQLVKTDNPQPGRLRLVLRRHHPDSTALRGLAPGTDTLGQIRLTATSRDLLTDVETPVGLVEDAGTAFDDCRLVRNDSSFVTPPDLHLENGSVVIRHPLYGDVNDDGFAATVADVIFLANYLAGIQQLTSRQRSNADVNRDGFQGTMADFSELVRIVVEE